MNRQAISNQRQEFRNKLVSEDAAQLKIGSRHSICAAEGAYVRLGQAEDSDALHHLPQGTIVTIAAVSQGVNDDPQVRISSPAGWIRGHEIEPAGPAPSIKMDIETFKKCHLDIAPGDNYGLDFPFRINQLKDFGAEFLTVAFRRAGTIAPDNAVTQIVEIEPLSTMGASESAFLTVAYERDEPGLQTRLFAKFPPDKGVEYKHALTVMSHGEVEMQRLARNADLPFATARYYFGDYCSETSNYLLITERINYGILPIEAVYRKGYDHLVPNPEEHYLLMAKALAGLIAAHKTGALGSEVEIIFPFARSARDFDPIDFAEIKVDRLIDFVGRIAPQLFIAEGTNPAFLRQWREDLLFGLEHKDTVISYLHENVDYTGLCHPNLNLDNAWFWRDETGDLKVGLIDWGGAGQMSIAQALSGMLMMPIPETYLGLQRHVIDTFIDEYAKRGGLQLDRDELLKQYKASVYSTAICTILSFVVDMLFQFSEAEYASMKDRHDERLLENGLYSAIIWIDNMLRDWLDEMSPGDVCRHIVSERLPAMRDGLQS